MIYFVLDSFRTITPTRVRTADVDQTKYITVAEFVHTVRRCLGIKPSDISDEELSTIYDAMDMDDDKKVNRCIHSMNYQRISDALIEAPAFHATEKLRTNLRLRSRSSQLMQEGQTTQSLE